MAGSGVVVDALLSGLVDASGNPLASGLLYSYEVGTTTPKSLYTDLDLTTTASNPYTLGADGTAQLYANGAYKFVSKTAAGATVHTWDYLSFSPFNGQSWSPTLGGFSVNPTAVYRYVQIGKLIVCSVRTTVNGTSNAGTFTISAPVTSATIANMIWISRCIQTYDNGAIITATNPIAYITSNSSSIVINSSESAGAFTAANAKGTNFTLVYEAA